MRLGLRVNWHCWWFLFVIKFRTDANFYSNQTSLRFVVFPVFSAPPLQIETTRDGVIWCHPIYLKQNKIIKIFRIMWSVWRSIAYLIKRRNDARKKVISSYCWKGNFFFPANPIQRRPAFSPQSIDHFFLVFSVIESNINLTTAGAHRSHLYGFFGWCDKGY